MSCGVGCRCSLDPALLWLWRRAVATVPIRTLAWESRICHGIGPRKGKKKKRQKDKKKKKEHNKGLSKLELSCEQLKATSPG